MPTRSSTAMSSRERIVDYIAAEGGRITSPDGRGLTSRLAAAAGYRDLGVLNAMLSRLETEGVIQRDIRGRRTFAITLLRRTGSSPAAAPRKTAAAKKSTAAKRSTGARKTTAKRASTKKASAKKTTAKRATAKKAGASKATAKKATARTSGKKASAKKATAKRTTAKKATKRR